MIPQAPPSFQPTLPTPTTSTTDRQSTSGVSALLRGATKKEEIDLITRYNLQSRVKSSDKGKAREEDTTADETRKERSSSSGGGGGGWAPTKDARQSILQKRRDEMILEARRKMMERDAAGGGAT